MEPFGVLNFIRSLLETDKAAESSPPPPNENPSSAVPPEEATTPPTQNSYLLFAKAHDERARKLRK